MRITAFLPVYNEESRIENCLKTISWCDEIIVLDKESSDKTREIASRYTNRIYTQKNTDAYSASEMNVLLKECNTDWILLYTASDLMHPEVALQVRRLLSNEEFEYDIIEIPFRRYVLGVGSKESPWYSEYSKCIFKKDVLRVNQDGVHDAVSLKSKKVFRINRNINKCMYHLTHETTDRMMERHIRYWRGEAASPEKIDLHQALIRIIKCLVNMVVVRRTMFRGKKGLALSFALLSYYMMSYVYQWESKYGDISCYENITKNIIKEWEEKKYSSLRHAITENAL